MANVMREKVAVAMSGGVDSSVAAAILKRDGHDVLGVTLLLHSEYGDASRAERIAKQLGIKHFVLDMKNEFKENVIDSFCAKYQNGATPNPCIVCNEKIKFGKLLEEAEKLGANKLATGHYVRTELREGLYHLYKGLDVRKDQSYFLYRLNQEKLGKSLFPLGNMLKADVYCIACLLGFPLKEERESHDICFISKGKSNEFLEENTLHKEGDVVNEVGEILGRHNGLPFYTIGQRRGVGISSDKPLYVVDIAEKDNKVIVGPNKSLYKNSFNVADTCWILEGKPSDGEQVKVKIRYRAQEANAKISYEGNALKIHLNESQRAITPGQSAVFYRGEEVLGGGVIIKGEA